MQIEQDANVSDNQSHLVNIGRMIEVSIALPALLDCSCSTIEGIR